MTDDKQLPSAAGDKLELKRITTRPMGLIPLYVAAAMLVAWLSPEVFHKMQTWLERPAPWLIGAVAIAYAVRTARVSSPLYLLLTVFAAVLTLREIHFGWMDKGVYVGAAVVGVWAVVWRKRLIVPLRDYRHTSWLLATFAAYAVAVMISRRFFRFVPGESEFHRSMEEWAETAAHLVFMVTAILGDWRKYPRFGEQVEND